MNVQEGISGLKGAYMDRKDRKDTYDTDKIRVYPDSDYTIEDYYSDFELDYLGFSGVPDQPGSCSGEKEKNTDKENRDDHPAG